MHCFTRICRALAAAAATSSLALASPASALVVYSLSDGSASVPGTGSPEDVIDCFGGINTPAADLGLLGLDDVDALVVTVGGSVPGSGAPAGVPGLTPAFSLQAGSSLGTGADVFASLVGGFFPPGPTTPVLYYPASGLAAQPGDDVDALDQHTAPPLSSVALFSLEAGNSFGFSGADLLAPGVSPSLVFTAADLGLVAADDIDALHLMGGDIYFSLAPGSASLGGSSPADIFLSTGTGSFALYASATDLGLLPSDNIDGLTLWLPEPGAAQLLVAGALGLLAYRRRGRRGDDKPGSR